MQRGQVMLSGREREREREIWEGREWMVVASVAVKAEEAKAGSARALNEARRWPVGGRPREVSPNAVTQFAYSSERGHTFSP